MRLLFPVDQLRHWRGRPFASVQREREAISHRLPPHIFYGPRASVTVFRARRSARPSPASSTGRKLISRCTLVMPSACRNLGSSEIWDTPRGDQYSGIGVASCQGVFRSELRSVVR